MPRYRGECGHCGYVATSVAAMEKHIASHEEETPSRPASNTASEEDQKEETPPCQNDSDHEFVEEDGGGWGTMDDMFMFEEGVDEGGLMADQADREEEEEEEDDSHLIFDEVLEPDDEAKENESQEALSGEEEDGAALLSNETKEEEDKAGEEEDKAGEEEDKAGEEEDKAGEEEDKAGEEEDKAGEEEDKAGEEEDEAGEDDYAEGKYNHEGSDLISNDILKEEGNEIEKEEESICQIKNKDSILAKEDEKDLHSDGKSDQEQKEVPGLTVDQSPIKVEDKKEENINTEEKELQFHNSPKVLENTQKTSDIGKPKQNMKHVLAENNSGSSEQGTKCISQNEDLDGDVDDKGHPPKQSTRATHIPSSAASIVDSKHILIKHPEAQNIAVKEETLSEENADEVSVGNEEVDTEKYLDAKDNADCDHEYSGLNKPLNDHDYNKAPAPRRSGRKRKVRLDSDHEYTKPRERKKQAKGEITSEGRVEKKQAETQADVVEKSEQKISSKEKTISKCENLVEEDHSGEKLLKNSSDLTGLKSNEASETITAEADTTSKISSATKDATTEQVTESKLRSILPKISVVKTLPVIKSTSNSTATNVVMTTAQTTHASKYIILNSKSSTAPKIILKVDNTASSKSSASPILIPVRLRPSSAMSTATNTTPAITPATTPAASKNREPILLTLSNGLLKKPAVPTTTAAPPASRISVLPNVNLRTQAVAKKLQAITLKPNVSKSLRNVTAPVGPSLKLKESKGVAPITTSTLLSKAQPKDQQLKRSFSDSIFNQALSKTIIVSKGASEDNTSLLSQALTSPLQPGVATSDNEIEVKSSSTSHKVLDTGSKGGFVCTVDNCFEVFWHRSQFCSHVLAFHRQSAQLFYCPYCSFISTSIDIVQEHSSQCQNKRASQKDTRTQEKLPIVKVKTEEKQDSLSKAAPVAKTEPCTKSRVTEAQKKLVPEQKPSLSIKESENDNHVQEKEGTAALQSCEDLSTPDSAANKGLRCLVISSQVKYKAKQDNLTDIWKYFCAYCFKRAGAGIQETLCHARKMHTRGDKDKTSTVTILRKKLVHVPALTESNSQAQSDEHGQHQIDKDCESISLKQEDHMDLHNYNKPEEMKDRETVDKQYVLAVREEVVQADILDAADGTPYVVYESGLDSSITSEMSPADILEKHTANKQQDKEITSSKDEDATPKNKGKKKSVKGLKKGCIRHPLPEKSVVHGGKMLAVTKKSGAAIYAEKGVDDEEFYWRKMRNMEGFVRVRKGIKHATSEDSPLEKKRKTESSKSPKMNLKSVKAELPPNDAEHSKSESLSSIEKENIKTGGKKKRKSLKDFGKKKIEASPETETTDGDMVWYYKKKKTENGYVTIPVMKRKISPIKKPVRISVRDRKPKIFEDCIHHSDSDDSPERKRGKKGSIECEVDKIEKEITPTKNVSYDEIGIRKRVPGYGEIVLPSSISMDTKLIMKPVVGLVDIMKALRNHSLSGMFPDSEDCTDTGQSCNTSLSDQSLSTSGFLEGTGDAGSEQSLHILTALITMEQAVMTADHVIHSAKKLSHLTEKRSKSLKQSKHKLNQISRLQDQGDIMNYQTPDSAGKTDKTAPQVVTTAGGTDKTALQVVTTAGGTDKTAPQVVTTAGGIDKTAPGVVTTAGGTDKTAPQVVTTAGETDKTAPRVVTTAGGTDNIINQETGESDITKHQMISSVGESEVCSTSRAKQAGPSGHTASVGHRDHSEEPWDKADNQTVSIVNDNDNNNTTDVTNNAASDEKTVKCEQSIIEEQSAAMSTQVDHTDSVLSYDVTHFTD